MGNYMGYYTILNEGTGKFEEKKSVFLSYSKRVFTEDEAKGFISEIKVLNRNARHNVYAYVLGEKMNVQRYSDDGEPQGTGGIPVLEVIKKNEVTDIVVVVTRYFGGVLLGVGGLTRAYCKAASLAINESEIVERVMGLKLEIQTNYELLGKLQYLFSQNHWHIEDIEYTDKIKIFMFCELNMVESIENSINEATSGKTNFKQEEEKLYFKSEKGLFL
jgi:uncharacterized YigZ family protein